MTMIYRSFFSNWLRKGAAFVFWGMLTPVVAFCQTPVGAGRVWGVGDTALIRSMLTESNTLLDNDNDRAAMDKIDSAENICRIIGMDSTLIMVNIKHSKGRVLRIQLKCSEAINNYQEALSIVHNVLGENSTEAYELYNSIGVCYSEQNEIDEAIFYYLKSLKVLTSLYGFADYRVAKLYGNIANVYVDKGHLHKAIEYNSLALSIFLKTEQESLDIATMYSNLGICYASIGQYNKGILYNEKSLSLRLKYLGRNHKDVGTSLYNIGVCYQYLESHEMAQEYMENSLEIWLKTIGENHPRTAHAYNVLGLVYSRIGKLPQAIACFEKSINAWSKFPHLSHDLIPICYNNIGNCYSKLKNHEKSIYYYKMAVNPYEKNPESISYYIARYYINLALEYEDICRDSAVFYYKKSLIILEYENLFTEKELDLQIMKKTLSYFGSYYLKNYRLKNDYISLDSALLLLQIPPIITHYQQVRELIPEDRSTFQYSEYFEPSIAVNLETAKVKNITHNRLKAFNLAEQSKFLLLAQALHETDALHFANIPDSLLEKEYDLRVDITYHEKKHREKLDAGLSETDTTVLAYSSKIFDLRQRYEALKDTFENKYPEYYLLKYDFSTVSLPCVRDTLLHSGQALLEYFVGDSSIFAFVVRRPEQKDASPGPDEGLHVLEIKKDFPLEAWVDSFRQGLYGYYSLAPGQRSDSLYAATLTRYIEYGRKLYARLVAPLEAWLPERVVVVPDGALGYLPFDALLTAAPKDEENFKDYPYLLHRHRFSYCYSATLLREMTDKKHHRAPSGEFAAFAPYFDGDTALLASLYPYDEGTRKDLQPLRYSGDEVAAARQLMGGVMFLGADATEKNFADTAGHYRILHLATHGRADNRVGDYAFLAFTEIKDSIENELLYVKDLYNMELNADLVVLSACETGIGKLQRGEGIISLARAFAYAGAKSIVTTLWSINDARTARLMGYFYDGLKKDRLSKDGALWQAQTRYLKETDPVGAHPFFWAAFIPIGDMRPVVR